MFFTLQSMFLCVRGLSGFPFFLLFGVSKASDRGVPGREEATVVFSMVLNLARRSECCWTTVVCCRLKVILLLAYAEFRRAPRDTWSLRSCLNLYHIMKTPPEEQAPITVTYLSPTLQVKLAEEARAEGIPITSLEGLKEALYHSFPDPNVQETLRSKIRQICAKKGVWD
uniref:Uncharacterized protein n=1 Tax=Chromera velia CCMP2878 TaxID=1169474 RepID=A0A0G4HZU0_9ALVE|eukprot:Cvel_9770.t1-p1 / transcript=Cvel_9770.t1 / gene=Cvel_9770 / organism=Chromera_velia_CCMP2878 / gene_product=hypothetical protein / transcript_product=hypothetical protein / location=Cvel_scaffold572:58910-61615(+) / protein_length=169 / sequence_SO=supercontig / SO=protein_coding / is_pseudo=false